MPSLSLRELQDVDILCCGEGEIVAAGIAQCIEKQRPLSSVNAITFRDGGGIVDTDIGPDPPDDLDQFPSPYLNEIINLQGKNSAMVSTARGCKYNCLFCVTPSSCGRKVRFHSVKRTLNEMEYLADKGIRHFWFRDENFAGSRERALEILRAKTNKGIKTPFWCQIRCDWVDEEIIASLREAGAETIALGLESANTEVLRKTGKGTSLDRMAKAIQLAKSAGLNVELFSIYGLPGETVEQARQTRDFVRSSKVPIRENSGGQQMQLYFGSTYENQHVKYGFRQTPYYLPAYLSIGDRYETETLTSRDFHKIQTMWVLSLDEMRRNVDKRERLFDLLNFLVGNEEYLGGEEAFYEYGAIAAAALEEQELLWRFLDGYVSQLSPNESCLSRLLSRLDIFRENALAVGSTGRVILDYRSDTNVSSLQMTGRYRDVRLGQNVLPQLFEKRLKGLRQGEETKFTISFPPDSMPVELRNRTVRFWVKIHKILNPVTVTSLKQLKSLKIRNHYVFAELDGLRDENQVLYYLALREVPEHYLMRIPAHFLAHMYYCARLHKMERVKQGAALLKDDKRALYALAEVLSSAGRHLEAAQYYRESGSTDSDTLIKEARSLFLGGKAQKALNVLNSMPEKSSLPFKELLVECMKSLRPHSGQIPPLDHEVLRLRVEVALEKETLNHTEQGDIQPIVHGSEGVH